MMRRCFLSSRSRHTRCGRDWSSDVCSSDLPPCPSEHLLRLDVADYDDDGVVRRIPLPVPSLSIPPAHVLQVLHPPDRRPFVGMRGKSRGKKIFIQKGSRTVFVTAPTFLHHHLDLTRELLWTDHEVRHAIGLELHR